MTDPSFLQEVQEDLDRQKLEALWKRYGGVALFGALVIVIATAGFTWFHSSRLEHNQQATVGLLELGRQRTSDPAKQIEALENFAKQHPGVTQGAFAKFHAAVVAMTDGKKDKAIALYDDIAHDGSLDFAFRQFADLLAVEAQMDSGDPVALQKRLQPLEAESAPWRFTAMEYDAYLALRAGDKAKAKKIFTELSQNAAVPKGLGARAADMLRYVSE